MKTVPAYYNTTHQFGEQLAEYAKTAASQEEVILEIYRLRGVALSPSEVLAAYPGNVPLTSIRRAITNLTSRGKLRKTDVQVTGSYGRPEYCWKIVADTPQLSLTL